MSVCQSVCLDILGLGCPPRCCSCPDQASPRPSGCRETPRAEVGGAAPACKPQLVPGRGRGPSVTRGRGVGASERRGGAGRPPSERGPRICGEAGDQAQNHMRAERPGGGGDTREQAVIRTETRRLQKQQQQQPLQLEQQQ